MKSDEEVYDEQFDIKGDRLLGSTKVGEFSIDMLELNRSSLRKLRSLRKELYECEEFVRSGVYALLDFGIDRLPKELRTRALATKSAIPKVQDELEDAIDDTLRMFARSELLDAEAEDLKTHVKERNTSLKQLRGIFPEAWRGREKR